MRRIRFRALVLRRFLRWWCIFITRVLCRMEVTGLEHLRDIQGPVIFAANHPSTFDPVLLSAYLPKDVQFVGPGDFRLRFPNRIIMEQTDIILVKRGYADLESLNSMMAVLKSGGQLAIFPEGGNWEKNLYDCKPGAVYLSMICKTPIVPIAISGTYNGWYKVLRLQRPKMAISFGEPIPPMVVQSRKTRDAELEHASYEMMDKIYHMLREDERERYDTYANQAYIGEIEVEAPNDLEFADEVAFPVLAELVSKPNLFTTFHEHAKLPVRPFVHLNEFHNVRSFQQAVLALEEALRGPLREYVAFRLGEDKAHEILDEIEILKALLDSMTEKQYKLRFGVHVFDIRDQGQRNLLQRWRNKKKAFAPTV